jgi:NAD(P)-dependent dehydrogenase (short-subunit alcohol dehydrogenase family)
MINEIKLANAVPYAVSKAALNTLFAKLNAAYGDEGILFMSLCPGLVATAEDEKTCKCLRTHKSLVISEADTGR